MTRVWTQLIFCGACCWLALSCAHAAAWRQVQSFVGQHCVECHDSDVMKGGLDLTALKTDLSNSTNFAKWIKVHDRVASGEMPPKKKERPPAAELGQFTNGLARSLVATQKLRYEREGRATQRRLNRYEYENALRDLLHAPWLQIRDSLPEDGESHRFNKVGDALDVSHVQMARYMNAAEYALRQVLAKQVEQPESQTMRYSARDQRSFTGPMKFSVFNTAPERATFPVLGFRGQPDVRAGKAPVTVGSTNAELRELEGVGVVASTYEPLEPKFNQFRAPAAGRYKLRFNAYSVWVGPGVSNRWYIPNLDDISQGRRPEPVTIYSETPPRLLRLLGKFDVTPEPSVHELDVWLLAGETIRPDPARLFRSRPGAARWQNPLAERDGQPGVVFRWLEVEGPIHEEWPSTGHKLMFADLPLTERGTGNAERGTGGQEGTEARERGSRSGEGRRRGADRGAANEEAAAVEPQPRDIKKDSERLLRRFMEHAYRSPVTDWDVNALMPVIERALNNGLSFADAMIAGYTAVLCSPRFVCVQEMPGRLDDHAVASRLAFFLWNSPPDDELRALADKKSLRKPAVLRQQTERLLGDPRSRRFVDAFLDYWLDLRHINATSPDGDLYPDYYLDDLLTESALEESQLFFAELMRGNLPARNIASSDFAMLNERLAAHYGLPHVDGVSLKRVSLPGDSVRGGMMTHASVLKVTANGTTTSPVLRGAWILERMLGERPPPPPASVPAVEPDIRGAVTIRQQLEQHRTQESCASCHVKIDPPGFALENFDVMGGWRERYRAQGEGTPDKGIGKNGQKFAFHSALPVDASGEVPDGRKFKDIKEFKALLLTDERLLARNLARHLTVYATGAPVGFADRQPLERILDGAAKDGYGVKTLIHEMVQSELFLMK